MALSVVRALALSVLLAGVGPAQAQTADWPTRSVRLILPFGAGSATDIAARLIGDKLSARWGRPVLIENRAGGDGLIAINAFLSAADDHVLLYASSASFLAHPYTQEKLSYDLERDLAPIARVSDTVLSAGVAAETPFKTFAEMLEAARKTPEKVNFSGAPGLPDFAVDAFIKNEKLTVTKVPYRDVVQAGRDLAENRIQFLLSSAAVVIPHVQAGKVRIVAIGARERTALFPDVPSVVEVGAPGLAIETTAGLYGPKSMPLALRQRLSADVIAAANDPQVKPKIEATGQDVKTGGPEVLIETLRQQTQSTAAIAATLGMARKN